ncbi:MAG: ATP-binding cassette domain-containing protein [Candidatus Aminicenantes bacterium]|nr:ATP-binding cassette domain-containing protein [Candidatus Aminicenantes bacterium]
MIQMEELYKSFGEKQVLQGLSLQIEKGETMAVIGQSGSGKSVLIKHMIGLMKPDSGKIIIDGVDICCLTLKEFYDIRRKFGLLFQAAALFDSLTVAENVSFGVERYRDHTSREIRKIVTESLELVGLRGIEDLMPHELSGGMKKRVGLARAIAYRPEIILYDEPSTGIDPIRADAINDLILRMQQELNVTSIVITHDMVSAYKVADRIAMLYNGVIIETGSPQDIQQSPNEIVQQFIHGHAEGPIKEW